MRAEAAGGAALDQPSRLRWRRPVAGRMWLAGPLALYALLRVPSFLEPHWYTDEAGYVTTARSVLQGQVLYTQIWTNKPPIDIWTVGIATRILGTSEAGLHAVTFLTGLATLGAIAYAGSRLLGRRRTLVALLLAAAALGSPLFDAELILPESLLIAPLTWAGAILLTRVGTADAARWPRWPVAAGILVGVAVGIQQTALAETCAFGLILALVGPEGSAGRVRARRLGLYAAGFATVTGLWLVPSVITAGVGRVAYALAGFYLGSGYTQNSTPSDLGLLLALTAGLVLIVGSAWLRRRSGDPALGLWIWAGAALLIPAVARQPWPHYLVPSLAPGLMAVSSLGIGWRRRPAGAPSPGPRLPRRVGALGLVAGVGLAAWGASVAGVDWGGVGPAGAKNLADYYGGALTVLTRGESLVDYGNQFDQRVAPDRQVSQWITAHGLQGSSAVVWSADAWLYELARLRLLLPTPPIYNDDVLVGADGQLGEEVAQIDPELVVTQAWAVSSDPSIMPVLEAGYQAMDRSSDGTEIVWVRDDLVAAVMAAAPSQ